MVTTRDEAAALDAADPLAGLRDRFVVDDPALVYLDGNSLGRLPVASYDALTRTVRDEWGGGLVRSWGEWIERPAAVGDLLAEHLLGAGPGEVVVTDSTTVNLYKLLAAALSERPERQVIVTDDDNFPTDRYVVQGLAAERGLTLRVVPADPVDGPSLDAVAAALRDDVAVATFSHVAYRSGALLDMAAVNGIARAAGVRVVWDLAHSAGALPVRLRETGSELAVGCTYKYLNAGPGAPAFLYAARELHDRLRSPVWGWFGQSQQFDMGPDYDPDESVLRFTAGTPSVPGLTLVEVGVRVLADAGIDRLRAKSVALTSLLIELADAWLAPMGFEVATPRDPARRGGHVVLRHRDAWPICHALVEQCAVVPDFRRPDLVRLGPAPAYTRFVDVWDGMQRLRDLVASGRHLASSGARSRVT